jgi:hypothetical protein
MPHTGKQRGKVVHNRVCCYLSRISPKRARCANCVKYFQLKSWSEPQKTQWLKSHSGAYASYVFP